MASFDIRTLQRWGSFWLRDQDAQRWPNGMEAAVLVAKLIEQLDLTDTPPLRRVLGELVAEYLEAAARRPGGLK